MKRLLSWAIFVAFLSLIIFGGQRANSAECRWDDPGHNPYLGSVEDALSHHKDIPAANKAEILRKIAERRWDDHVEIRANGSITGKYLYTNLRGMVWGVNRYCDGPVKWKWPADRVERALVFTSGRWNLTCPSICRNCALTDRGKPVKEVSNRQPATGKLPPEGLEFVTGGGASVVRPLNPVELAPPPTSRDPVTGVLVPAWPPQGWPGIVISTPPPVIHTPTNVVPEPATWALLLLGVVALAVTARRKK